MQNQTTSCTFRAWLAQHEYEDSPIGDLAKDALSDSTWVGDTYLSLHSHLLLKGACYQAFEALDMADRRYMLEHPDVWLNQDVPVIRESE